MRRYFRHFASSPHCRYTAASRLYSRASVLDSPWILRNNSIRLSKYIQTLPFIRLYFVFVSTLPFKDFLGGAFYGPQKILLALNLHFRNRFVLMP